MTNFKAKMLIRINSYQIDNFPVTRLSPTRQKGSSALPPLTRFYKERRGNPRAGLREGHPERKHRIMNYVIFTLPGDAGREFTLASPPAGDAGSQAGGSPALCFAQAARPRRCMAMILAWT
jgi:hypothetical protein